MIEMKGLIEQVEEPKWLVGKWTFRVRLTLIDDGASEEMISPYYFDTRLEAEQAMDEAMRIADMQARELIKERLH